MIRAQYFTSLSMLVLVAVLFSSCNKPTAAPGNPPKGESIESALPGNISKSEVREFAECQLRSAVWGGYDAVVNVEAAYTSDKKPRRFDMIAGRLSVRTLDTDVSTGSSRSSLVKISSKEEAFSKDVPFFIDNVLFTPPDSLSFRVTSNPAFKGKTALPRIQRVERGESGYTSSIEIVVSRQPVTTDTESTTINLKETRLDGWVLSVVAGESRCLASNEIDLSSLVAK